MPLDDRGLTASAGWTKVPSQGSYLGTVSKASAKGKVLSKTVKTKRLALLVTRCPTCGSVRVFLGSTRLGTFSLKGEFRKRVMIPVRTFGAVRSGTVRIVVISRGKKVMVDALATSRR